MAGIAKITKPRLFRVAPRKRLFGRLDELAAMPATWVFGAPGAGKTTLVASYAEARRRPLIWFHCDEGDNDPASFYLYLSQAAERYRRKRAPLPLAGAGIPCRSAGLQPAFLSRAVRTRT